MSVVSSFDAKEQIRQAVDIVDLVGEQLPLRREGRIYKALCPWHDDTRPSLQVNPERQSFRCWVCDVGGDIFSFVMKMEGVDFREALTMLADRAGIPLQPPRQPGGPPGVGVDEKRTLYRAMAWAEQQFQKCLLHADEGQAARAYLQSRGISAESIRQFHLGFSPDHWDWLLNQPRPPEFTPKVLEKVGLIGETRSAKGYYDRFKGRVLFSIRDTQGRPIAFGGRVLPEFADDRSAKYVNSPETPLFVKSKLLYGLDVAKDAVCTSRTAVVMEGYTDCVMAHQYGFANAVAVLGTALGQEHVKLLRRFADRIVLVLDGDEAGRRRTDEVLPLFVSEQVDLRILTLPEGMDPCDFLLQRGAHAFEQAVAGAVDALEHKFRTATAQLGPADETHRANQALEQVLATLAQSPRLQSGTSSAARLKEDQILNRLAHKAGVSEERLRARLTDLRRQVRRGSQSRQAAVQQPPAASEQQSSNVILAQRWMLEILLQQPELIGQVRGRLAVEQIPPGHYRAIYACCCALDDEGIAPTFQRLLLELDDPELKSLLVRLDEECKAKNRAEPARELEDLLRTLWQHHEQNQLRARPATTSPAAGSQEELEELRHIIERERHRQGISGPTDG